MSVLLIPPADQELQDAAIYYNGEVSGLGDQFYASFLDAVDSIAANPEMWRKIGQNTRRCNIKRFPYLVLYVFDSTDILITCIAHQHRNPEYYRIRIS
ncbi:type II toxin-antitoxin system RelE/ParE family toxin [Desulfonatronum sp. SC1]|uniref:type II toxin-antitoxin system RelE/ParE family toxin n=1 Tax=Desulfonatronum sp. SC1 TaxID=2109626 RepID=UPI000D306303|nr:plasmid stabilization protein [Desulfonatronum sp. SC1]